MIEIHPEYIIDDKSQRKAVVIPISEWKKIMEEIEELEDIREYDAARSREEQTIAFDEAIKNIGSGDIK